MFKKINIQEKSVVVELKDKGETYKGIAKIHPDDVDFQSKETLQNTRQVIYRPIQKCG